MSKKLFWFISIIAVCLIGVVVLNNVQHSSASIDYEGQPFLGEASAPVSIVEFGDYKCPHCKDFNNSTLPMIHEELVKTGKAKFYYINYAFISPDSKAAAQFAETVYEQLGNEKFWSFHHTLFANQTTASGELNFFSDEMLAAILAQVATPEETEQVVQAYKEGKGNDPLQKDMTIAKSLGVNSTPTMYVNGKQFQGKTINDLIKEVDEAIKNGQ